MKKSHKLSEDHLRDIINFMLREYDVDYDYVVRHPIINKMHWFQYYWDDEESKEVFLDWLRKYIKQNIKCSSKILNEYVSNIDLMWGLKVY